MTENPGLQQLTGASNDGGTGVDRLTRRRRGRRANRSAVHVVFNNAGIAYAGSIADTSHDDWQFVIDVDLWGPIHGVEAFLPRLLAQKDDSHMVFTSSFAGLIPSVGLGPYCVAKYGVVALAETLSREVRPNGIGVSVLCPMIVETDLMANSERVSE